MNSPLLAGNPMTVTSPDFSPGEPIPSRCSYKGGNLSPTLQIEQIPKQALSLALIVDDPDAPAGLWTHWTLWNVSPSTSVIPENSVPVSSCQGRNSFGNSRYDGPAPPSGTHRYFFKIYALDALLKLPSGASRKQLDEAMKSHVLGMAEMYGTYSSTP